MNDKILSTLDKVRPVDKTINLVKLFTISTILRLD